MPALPTLRMCGDVVGRHTSFSLVLSVSYACASRPSPSRPCGDCSGRHLGSCCLQLGHGLPVSPQLPVAVSRLEHRGGSSGWYAERLVLVSASKLSNSRRAWHQQLVMLALFWWCWLIVTLAAVLVVRPREHCVALKMGRAEEYVFVPVEKSLCSRRTIHQQFAMLQTLF